MANGLIFRLDDAVRTKSPTEARQLIVATICRARGPRPTGMPPARLALYERSLALREQVAAEDPSDRVRFLLGDWAPARADARRVAELFAGAASVDAAAR